MIQRFFIIIFIISFFAVSNYSFAQLVLTEDEDVSISAVVGGITPITPETSSGGVVFPNTAVQFKGSAYPNAEVFLLKDGVFKNSVFADNNARFAINLPEDEGGNNLYTLYAVDKNNQKSLFLNFPTKVKEGYLNFLNNILFAPTISADKLEVSLNGFINFSGYAVPFGSLEITIKSLDNENIKNFSLNANKDGIYNINIPLSNLEKGDYTAFIKYKNDTRVSKLLRFTINNRDILNEDKIEYLPGDCNKDNIINLVDFSVLAFWYKKPNPPLCVDIKRDNIVDLIDFSILAYYWNN